MSYLNRLNQLSASLNFRKKITQFSLCPLLFVFSYSAAANQPLETATSKQGQSLTLQQALKLAEQGNVELQLARNNVEASQAQVRQGGLRPNPELVYELDDVRGNRRNPGVLLTLPVELGDKREARISAAQANQALAEFELSTMLLDIRNAVRLAFLQVANAQDQVQLMQDSLVLAQRVSAVASKRVLAGKVSAVELSKANVAEAGVAIELNQAHSELAQAKQALNAYFGDLAPRYQKVQTELVLLPQLPALNLAELEHAPALREAQLEVDSRQAKIQLERSKQFPDLRLLAGIKRDDERSYNQMQFAVSIPLPIFDRNQGNLQEAVARAEQARTAQRGAAISLRSQVLQTHQRLLAAYSQIDVLQSISLPAAKSAYEASSIGFEYGKFNFLDVLDAQRSYFQSKAQHLKALSDMQREANALNRLLGTTVFANSLFSTKE